MTTMETEVHRGLPGRASVVHRNEALGYVAVELPERPADREFETMCSRVTDRPGVQYAERNATYEVQVVPNDPSFDSQQAPQQVDAQTAWDTTFGSTDVTVAVIDTGAQYDHPDLDALYADDPGEDFVDDDGDPFPDDGAGHGTHVSGCASADTDNGEGVAGVSDSRLLNARCVTGRTGSTADIADGIQWATDQGADVINLSLGGSTGTRTMKAAVEYAYDQNDVLVVAAAGNEGASQVSFPARYEECVAVSAIDPDGNLASFSNFGDAVEVAAPGVNVLSTVPTDGYQAASGTSMAAPVAAGVAALGKAANPDLSASELRQRLRDTAVDVGLPATEQGNGRVDAANVVGGGSGGDDSGGDGSGDGSGDDSGGDGSGDGSGGDGSDGGTDPGPDCSQTTGGSVSERLWSWWDEDAWTYTLQFDQPCEVTVDLEGPGDADFDLYVTLDGRSPDTDDFDTRSASGDSTESVTVGDVTGDQQLGILVDSSSGSGSYTLSVEESGAGS